MSKLDFSEDSFEPNNNFELKPGKIIVHQGIAGVYSNIPQQDQVINYYKIIKNLSDEKSFGCSYKACKCVEGKWDTNNLVFLKTPRVSQDLLFSEFQQNILQDIFTSFLTEYCNRGRIEELNKYGKVAAETQGFGFYVIETDTKGQEIMVPFLIQEFVNNPDMPSFFGQNSKYWGENKDYFKGIREPDLWFELSEQIINIVRRAHNRLMIHGEILPKNILLEKIKPDGEKEKIQPILVDFGRPFLTNISLLAAQREKHNSYIAPECRMGGSVDITADIYSLGGVLYYLATGESPPDYESHGIDGITQRSEDIDKWKNIIHKGFRKNNDLMRKNESIVKILDKCLRLDPSDRYPSVEKIVHALRAINYQKRKDLESVSTRLKEVNTKWKSIQEDVKKKNLMWDDVFNSIGFDRLDLLYKELENMHNGHFEIYGEREDLIDTLVKYISALQDGDTYVTVTVPEYWTEDNLGVNGRFLTVNKDIVRNGINVNRLFLLSDEDLEIESSRKILKTHLAAWKSLAPYCYSEPFFGNSNSNPNIKLNGMMYVGCHKTSKEAISKYQSQNPHVAIWSRSSQSGI
ncbi:MAG: protein kinase, partial [Candidatus Peribacteraceae bacterium]|nr:protein kinase [Candidatus Peribacteraceae bacterium]